MKKLSNRILSALLALLLSASVMFGTAADDNAADSGTAQPEYIEITQDTIDLATTEITVGGKNVAPAAASIDELYGSRDFPLPYDEIARLLIAVQQGFSDFTELSFIKLSQAIPLEDENARIAHFAYNFSLTGASGYIIIAAHTRARLLERYVLGESYSGGPRYLSGTNGSSLADLAAVELETVSYLNNLAYYASTPADGAAAGADEKYAGQPGKAYGYGGIADIIPYLEDRYGGTAAIENENILPTPDFVMSEFSNGGVCSIVALTRVLAYWRGKGFDRIDENNAEIFNKLFAFASKTLAYTDLIGTIPFFIDDVALHVVNKDYGYTGSQAANDYLFKFDTIKSEIDADRPTAFNITFGYYASHSVTANGYVIAKTTTTAGNTTKTQTHHLVAVNDGWTHEQRYIDFEAFLQEVVAIGNVTKITVKDGNPDWQFVLREFLHVDFFSRLLAWLTEWFNTLR
ncbi:MAG: hypothetical protein LBT21_05630 [Oscillospiraceae bacterium]|jgi:hypothetical protein|nr:hypothetical protein [Oscillospiraceae bacterium]